MKTRPILSLAMALSFSLGCGLVSAAPQLKPDVIKGETRATGVRVAVGDVNGISPTPRPVGLLLPAVQKAREAATR